MTRSFNILIVEQSDFLREKIAGVLSRRPNIWMVAQVSNYSNLMQAMRKNEPDILLVDMSQVKSRRETIAEINREFPETRIMLFADADVSLHQDSTRDLGDCMLIDLGNLTEEFEKLVRDLSESNDNGSEPEKDGNAGG